MTLPLIHPIQDAKAPSPEKLFLNNNIPVFGFNGTTNDILRIDLIFNSGRWTEPAKYVAATVAKLFKSGTASLSSFEISEQIELYGSTIKASAGYNTFTVSLYCMNRFLEPSLQWLMTCLTEISFPEKEIELHQKNAISKLKVSREKNDYLAEVAFKKALYGNVHPYGYENTESNIEHISQTLLQQFYHTDLRPDNCTIFLAGKYGDKELKLVDAYLGRWTAEKSSTFTTDAERIKISSAEKKIRISKEKSVQASIIIGKEFFNKHHEDYATFILLNTIFGGYFGSRLMSNIREDKGLTYGIHSGVQTLRYDAVFSIQTDTNVETLGQCLREIYFEAERLQNELIPEHEITLARNYLMGKFLSRTDGPFNQSELFKNYYVEGVDIHKFEEFEETIRQSDALSLQRLAQKYFLKESMYEVVVG
jgi:predicted Zn-dependent peptidase